jgi:hypothetical protein
MASQRFPERVVAKALPPPAVIDKIPPPHDLDAEAAVLSAVILDPTQLDNVPGLQPKHFYSGPHDRVWEAILYLRARGEKIDIVQVGTRLKAQDRIAEVGGMAYLTELLNAAPAVANAHAYGQTIITLSRLRDLAAVAQRVSARCYVDRADPAEVMAEAERLVSDAVRTGFGPIRLGADQLFEEALPDEPAWVCKGLLLAPGRVALAAGSPDSGKTLSWQSIGISVASGAKAWEQFDIQRQGLVVHLNWDQELEATKRRYRRLLRGRDLSVDAVRGYLEVIDDPPFALDTDVGIAELRAICRGATLVIVDALTGALSDTDEKDPIVGRWLRKMGKISEQTGAVIVVIHHAVKPPPTKGRGAVERDAVFDVRGSSAIPGASGAQYSHMPIKKGELYAVRMGRPPTNAKRALDPFALRFLDVKAQGESEDLFGEKRPARADGVRVAYVSQDEIAELTKKDGKKYDGQAVFEQFAYVVLEKVKAEPDINTTDVHQRFGKGTGRPRVESALKWLQKKALVTTYKGARNADFWRAT